MERRTLRKLFVQARRASALSLVVWGVAACAAQQATHRAATEERDATGFTIHESVHIGVGVRGDFEDALDLLKQEHFEQGIARLQEVAESAPDAAPVYIDLGIAYERVGDAKHAEESLQRAVELNPRHPVAWNELAILQRKAGRFADARASYEKALDAYPEFHFARRNLAILCDLYLADMDCALKNYELYTQAVPSDETAAMWVTDLRNRMAKGSKKK